MRSALLLIVLLPGLLRAETAVFWQKGFPAADSEAPSRETLAAVLKEPRFLDEKALAAGLKADQYPVLVLPYGSAFPEPAWEALKAYLNSGGSLLVLGGMPLTVPVAAGRSRRTLAYCKRLFIHDAFEVPMARARRQVGAEESAFLALPEIRFSRLFSMAARLSEKEVYPRLGSWGTMDGRWRAAVYAVDESSRPVAAPVELFDHWSGEYAGSRWVFTPFEPAPGYWEGREGRELIAKLAAYAARGSVGVRGQPTFANYHFGEQAAIAATVLDPRRRAGGVQVRLDLYRDGKLFEMNTVDAEGAVSTITLPSATAEAYYEARLSLLRGAEVLDEHRTGFWRKAPASLASGVPFGVDAHYLTRGGRTYPVLGTTYMSGENHRYFLLEPNVSAFERDMTRIEAAGLNMIRTGVWTGWDRLAEADGTARESTLRAIEAFLLSAKRHGLPAQFCFFSFIPDAFGGENPYLDAAAVARQKRWVQSITRRFKNDPDLMWDLINEPSFSNPRRIFDGNVPNRDEFELKDWNAWLLKRHGSIEAVARAWNMDVAALKEKSQGGRIPLPEDWELKPSYDEMYWGATKPLKAYDYNLFAQEAFEGWTRELTAAIRATGSRQLVTFGQDAGGNMDRLMNQTAGGSVDFTDNHLWRDNDFVAWNVLSSRRLDKPNLIQETGVLHREAPDETARLDEAAKGRWIERRCAAALGAGAAGVIEWVWNTNLYMRDDQEATIGALRGDGTEKPETEVLRSLAAFAKDAFPYFDAPEAPAIAVVLPQALQLGIYNPLALEATQNAARALAYRLKRSFYFLPESELVSKKEASRLLIVPSALVLTDGAWSALLERVQKGGDVLLDGPAERDEYFRPRPRLGVLRQGWEARPLTARESVVAAGGKIARLSFGRWMDRLDLDYIPRLPAVEEIILGDGRFWVDPYPAELNDNLDALAKIYEAVLARALPKREFETDNEHPGVLVRRTVFKGASLYLVISESAAPESVRIKDAESGGSFQVSLPPERSALVLIDRKTGAVLVRYHPPAF